MILYNAASRATLMEYLRSLLNTSVPYLNYSGIEISTRTVEKELPAFHLERKITARPGYWGPYYNMLLSTGRIGRFSEYSVAIDMFNKDAKYYSVFFGTEERPQSGVNISGSTLTVRPLPRWTRKPVITRSGGSGMSRRKDITRDKFSEAAAALGGAALGGAIAKQLAGQYRMKECYKKCSGLKGDAYKRCISSCMSGNNL